MRRLRVALAMVSGGAFALQAAALVLLLHAGSWFLADDRNGYLIFLAVNFVLGIGASFLPGVAMAAHVGGAVTGFLLTVTGLVLLGRPALDGGQESPLSAAIAWGLAAVLVIAWIAAGIRVQRGRADLPRPDPKT
ncbi:MAG: hypothetical protein IT381_29220 [Deltaproteobacteria bacterium]|nr:hypothetical protein [Deltaproteobacteria bacterium]